MHIARRAAAFSETIVFDVPPEYAFDFLADPSTAPIIDPAVIEYRPDDLPMREGVRVTIRKRNLSYSAAAVASGLDSSLVYVESRFLRPPMNSVIGKPSLSIVPTTRYTFSSTKWKRSRSLTGRRKSSSRPAM